VSVPLAVFASGGGSNLQSILDHFGGARDAADPTRGGRAAHVALVVSDRADAGALARAAQAGVATVVIPVRGRPEAEIADQTQRTLAAHRIAIVALAGYLRLVPADVVRGYEGRIVNIHPSLLPAFGGPGMYGMRVHGAVLEAGCTVTGATVHLVDEVYDRGRVLAQWPVPVLPGDDAQTLAARVLAVEHRLYPAVLGWLAGRIGDGAGAETAAPAGRPAERFGLVAAADPDEVIASMIRA
jgi:phosphoribosylglycinamide formyltransferase 1